MKDENLESHRSSTQSTKQPLPFKTPSYRMAFKNGLALTQKLNSENML